MSVAFDLIVTGGCCFDPLTGGLSQCDVGFRNGRVAAMRTGLDGELTREHVDAMGAIIAPGLIDMHAHVFDCVGDSVDPDRDCLTRGSTTVVDGGSAGANTFEAFVRLTQHKKTRVLAWLNLSTIGQVDTRVGELLAAPHADVERAISTIDRYPDLIVGLKARLSTYVVGGTAVPVLKLLREAADETKRPIMIHIGDTGESLGRILEFLHAGDVVSHMMTGRKNGLVDAQGRVKPEVLEARDRGIFFEAARGLNHEAFPVVEACVEQGFLPDVISTDLTRDTARNPEYGLALMASHLMSFGLGVTEALVRMTRNPALIIGRPELGTLVEGGIGDCTILREVEEKTRFIDVDGRMRDGRKRLVADAVIRHGELVTDSIVASHRGGGENGLR